MLGRAKCQSRMALRGAASSHFYKLPRGRRNPPGVGRAGSHSRTWAARNAHDREWLSGHERFSRGVDSNDKDLLWLLAPTKFDK